MELTSEGKMVWYFISGQHKEHGTDPHLLAWPAIPPRWAARGPAPPSQRPWAPSTAPTACLKLNTAKPGRLRRAERRCRHPADVLAAGHDLTATLLRQAKATFEIGDAWAQVELLLKISEQFA